MPYREIITGAVDRFLFGGNDSGNAPALLMLGGFKFSLNTAVFQELQRSTAFRWPAQERVGQFDALQFTGPSEDRITLPGTVYPNFRGGEMQIDDLRAIAAQGKPLRLIGPTGTILGLWVVESVEEKQGAFNVDGKPRRQDFTLVLKKFGDDADV